MAWKHVSQMTGEEFQKILRNWLNELDANKVESVHVKTLWAILTQTGFNVSETETEAK